MLMTHTENGEDAYKQTQEESVVSVSSKFEMICMLHETLLDRMDRMALAIEEGDLEVKTQMAQKCLELLGGLDAMLDLEAGQLIVDIHNMYEAGTVHITDASIKMDIKPLLEYKPIIEGLLEGWRGAMVHVDSLPTE